MTVSARVADLLPEGARSGATLWIDNHWQAAAAGRSFESHSPITGEALAILAAAGTEDIAQAVRSSQAAQADWAACPPARRAALLTALGASIRARADRFALLETLDGGRALRDTRHAAVRAAGMAGFYAGLCDKIRGKTVPSGDMATTLVDYEPIGVFAAITPWNYPLSNAMTKLAPLLACGNSVVLKPAELTPLVTLLLAEALEEAGFPPGVVNILTGDGSAGAALVAHPGIDKVTFTGSTATGRRIAQAAGDGLKGCILELGGKSPMVIFEDADLPRAAEAAVFSSFMNAGQTCTSCNRVLVARPLRADFLEHVARLMDELRIGDPRDPDTQIGPVISAGQNARITALTAQAPVLLTAPRFSPLPGGHWQCPRVIDGDATDGAWLQDEIFGPVMSVQSFDSDEEAWQMANATPYGLAASVWTDSLARAEAARRRIAAGVIWINCVHSLGPNVPVAGQRASGLGSEYGWEVIEQHMRLKSTVQMYGGWVSPFSQ